MPDVSCLSLMPADQTSSELDDLVSEFGGSLAPGWFSLIPEAEFLRWSEQVHRSNFGAVAVPGSPAGSEPEPKTWKLRVPWEDAYDQYHRCVPDVIALRPELESPLDELLEMLEISVPIGMDSRRGS